MLSPRRALPVLAACAVAVAVLTPGTAVAGPSARATSSASPSASPSSASPSAAYTVSTVAGNGDEALYGDGGPATSAGLGGVDATAVAPDGTLYLYAQRRLRAVDPATHRIDTVAGPFSHRLVHGVDSMAAGPDGTVYLADQEGFRVLAVDPRTHRLRTVAGTGRSPDVLDLPVSGRATRVPLFPTAVAVDAHGALYIADAGDETIARVRPRTGRYTMLVKSAFDGQRPKGVLSVRETKAVDIAVRGDGAVVYTLDDSLGLVAYGLRHHRVDRTDTRCGDDGIADFDALAADPSGTVYVACHEPARLVAFHLHHGHWDVRSLVGAHAEAWVLGDGGPADRAWFGAESGPHPVDLAAGRDGTVYVSDTADGRIRSVHPAGRRPAGRGSANARPIVTLADADTLNHGDPNGRGEEGCLTVDTDGTAYTCNDFTVVAVDPRTGRARDLSGRDDEPSSGGTESASDHRLDVLAVAAGRDHRLYLLAEETLPRDTVLLRVLDPARNTVRTVTAVGSDAIDLAVAPDGDVYVAGGGRLCVVSRGRGPCRRIGDHEGRDVERVAAGPDGTVYVAGILGQVRRLDRRNDRLVPVTADLRLGPGEHDGDSDGGPALSAQVRTTDLAVGPDRTLYLVDDGRRVRAVDPRTGVVTTVAGPGRAGHRGDGGTAGAARFTHLSAIAAGPGGRLYLGDEDGDRLRAVGVAAPHDDRPLVVAVVVIVVVLVLAGVAVLVLLAVRRRRRTAGVRRDPAPPTDDHPGPPSEEDPAPPSDPAPTDGESPVT